MIYLIFILVGILLGLLISTLYWKRYLGNINENYHKILSYYFILNDWLSNQTYGYKVDDFFIKNNYSTIAIYGMKELGLLLYDKLEKTDINVKYVIDKNPEIVTKKIKCYRPTDSLPDVDAIIVTASYYFSDIRKQLEHTGYKIHSIEDVVCCKYS